MRIFVILALTAYLFAGCATLQNGVGAASTPRYSGPNRVAPAVRMLAKGNTSGAVRVLKAVCKGRAVPGVTDEALFRLVLLSLKPNGKAPVSRQGYELLKRLKREYPNSPWTAQAAPLMELIKVTEELSDQRKNLKVANESLRREINELNSNVEQLKDLDLELERKIP